jgi:hypothetical protein
LSANIKGGEQSGTLKPEDITDEYVDKSIN